LVANSLAALKPRQFERVVFEVVPDEAARRAKLAKGEIDLVDAVEVASIARYRRLEAVKVAVSDKGNAIAYLTLNTSRGPLADKKVRQALAKAIDYRTLSDRVMGGNVVQLNGPIPPGIFGYHSGIPEPKRNAERARELLAQAGHPGGIDLTLTVDHPGAVAGFIQRNLAEAGINLTIRSAASPGTAQGTGDFDILFDGWTLGLPDPSVFLNPSFLSPASGGRFNASGYSNPVVDQLLIDALTKVEEEDRLAIYRKVQWYLMDDKPILPLFALKSALAYRADVIGVRVNPYRPQVLNIADLTRAAR
jgi:peptide/nickel transport system substrate-binding protein